MVEQPERRTVSISQACKLVRVSRRTMSTWVKIKAVDSMVLPGRVRRIYEDSLWRDADGNRYPPETLKKTDLPRQNTIPIPEACDLVGVSRRTMYNWIEADKVLCVRTATGIIRIVENSLWSAPQWPGERPGAAGRAAANAHA